MLSRHLELMSDTLLRVDSLNVHYGLSHILQGVSLEVVSGTVVGLLGRNGAGKSTTLKSIMGIVPPSAGSVYFSDHDITGRAPHYVARQGIAYVPEDRGVFPSLSVDEHLTMVRPFRNAAQAWKLADVFDLFPPLSERRTLGGGQLSGGEQQMLSIARALLLNPRLLILDEPSEGLAPVVIEEISTALLHLKDSGLSILIVEQNYPLVMQLSDRVAVLGKGQIRWHGEPGALESNFEIKQTWLGV
jgi:branched-chain amino acid transport system ATP-binding protein